MKKLVALLTEEKRKTTINGSDIVTLAFFELLYSVYKKLGQFFFPYYSLTINKVTSVLSNFTNIWRSW